MAQSLAREFGPKGVHVSHAIIDGIINTEKTKGFGQDLPDAKIEPQGVSGASSTSLLVLALIINHRLRTLTGTCTPSLEAHSPMRLISDLTRRNGEKWNKLHVSMGIRCGLELILIEQTTQKSMSSM